MGMIKNCNICNIDKDTELFFKNKKASDGLFNYCKSCSNEKQNKYRELNKEKRNKLSLNY